MPETLPVGLPKGTVTFLFTDIEGSTELVQNLGDQYPRLLELHRSQLREACQRNLGVEFETQGDAFFAAFERPSEALAAAAAAQRSLLRQPWAEAAGLRIRVGLHTGEVRLGHGGYTGVAIHVVARVCAAAHGGQILLSDATRQIAPDIPVKDLGSYRLKGLLAPVRLFQLQGDDLPSEFPPLRALAADLSNLPASLDEFVGREPELAQVRASLSQNRLVTLTGPGGSGKTRLAVQVAAGFLGETSNGVWLVELATESDSTRIAPMTASALQVSEQPHRSLQATLEEALARRDLLLTLDNCEHMLDGVATFVTPLLAKCPAVRVLTTSREPLGVRGEVVHRIPPLSLGGSDDAEGSDAVRLFTVRALAANPAFDVDSNAKPLIVQVCRRLDGLPLAIELAAARLRSLPLTEVAARLDDRFRLLTGGSRTDLPRQRTLEAVVTWSYELLDEPERNLFRHLAIFPDSFTIESAAAVGGVAPASNGDMVELVSRLVDKSLIVGVDAPAGFRYQLLETLRQYGRERLADLGETAATRDKLLAWAMTHVDRLDRDIRTPRQDAALQAVNLERANIRSAMEWAQESGRDLDALRIVVAVPVGLAGERRTLIAELLGRILDPPQAVLARAHLTAANLAFDQADWSATTAEARAARTAFTDVGDKVNAAWASYFLILGLWGSDDITAVQELVPSTLEAFRQLDIPLGVAYMLWVASQHIDDPEEAERVAADGTEAFRALGSTFGLGHALEGRALISLLRDDSSAAKTYLAEALAIFAAAANPGCLAHCIEAVAVVAAQRGLLVQTAEFLGVAESLRDVSGQGRRPWERAAHRQSEDAIRRGIDQTLLDAARIRGRACATEVAVQLAEEVLRQAPATEKRSGR